MSGGDLKHRADADQAWAMLRGHGDVLTRAFHKMKTSEDLGNLEMIAIHLALCAAISEVSARDSGGGD